MKPNLNPQDLRKKILYLAYQGGAGHIGPSFSIVEILATLYSYFIEDNQDYLILSKGHGAMALYSVYSELKKINHTDIENYLKNGSKLHGLCEYKNAETSTGSLGHGLPVAVGMALGLKREGKSGMVYCIVGDGEMNEGSMWESMLFAAQHQLDNLLVIVDANGLQAMGSTQEIIDLGKILGAKGDFIPISFNSMICDGHDMSVLKGSIEILQTTRGRPHILIADTVKGYGVSFMHNNNEWHYQKLTEEIYQKALHELT